MAIVYEKIPGCILGQFSTLKFINGSNFKDFKNFFLAEYMGGFVVPAETFDNVKGEFPIGFTIWNTDIKSKIDTLSIDVYDKNSTYIGVKNFYGNLPENINKWIKSFDVKIAPASAIGFMGNPAPDFQHNSQLYISQIKGIEHFNFYVLSKYNLIEGSIYFSVRHSLNAEWLNDRDQFLFPKNGWQTDVEFQNDCLAFALFDGQNRISNTESINHWIPFTEQEVNAKNRFESHFMTDFINGKIKTDKEAELFESNTTQIIKREFSAEATAVFDAGRELWKYYHSQPNVNVNASLYDIREYFQGRNEKGRMNSKSNDETYMGLVRELRNKLNFLADKIKPKIYEYDFLKE